MALTDVNCRTARPREKMYKLSDRDGLHLRVEPNGSKLWRYSYRFNGRQKDLALGKYPVVTSHGWRATASTLLNESGQWSADAIERQLNHVEKDEARAAYARGEHWADRGALRLLTASSTRYRRKHSEPGRQQDHREGGNNENEPILRCLRRLGLDFTLSAR